MPVYEYECSACCRRFDEIRSFAASGAAATCPRCGATARKLISKPMLVRDDPTDWRDENGGRGRYITQLQTSLGSKRDGHAYCKSRREAIDKAYRRGDKVEIVA